MNGHLFKRKRGHKGRKTFGTRQLATLAAATGLLLGVGVGAVQAAAAYGNVASVYVGGRTYSTQSFFVSDAPAYAGTNQWTGSAVGAGWMGTNARTFYGNGTLCGDGGYYFNSGSTTFMGSAKYTTCGAHSDYYSWGVTAHWNGSGYSYWYTNRSPSLSAS